MKIKNVAAVVGVAAVAFTVLLSPPVSPSARAHDSEDSPVTTFAWPGANGQLAGGPTAPTAQLGNTAAAKPAAASPVPISYTPTTKATAAPSCTPTVFVPQCETLP
jgi:hypothetical protein